MQKTYSISANFGEITKDLDDRIQKDSFKRLRDNSLEEMTNVMPDKYFLAKSVNGVELEYFILGKPSKAFTLNTNGVETVFHIYEDRIITAIPSLDKIFIDTIPKDILVDVNSVDTAFITGNSKEQFLRFNSITGVYKCSILPTLPDVRNNGETYFIKIEIPDSTTANAINTIKGDVYIFYKKKSLSNQALILTESNLDLDLTGIYIANSSLKIGDRVQLLQEGTFPVIDAETGEEVLIFIESVIGTVIQGNIDGLLFTNKGQNQIYPSLTLPTDITQHSPDLRPTNDRKEAIIEQKIYNLPQVSTPIKLLKLDTKLSLDKKRSRIPFKQNLAIDYPNYIADEKCSYINTRNTAPRNELMRYYFVRYQNPPFEFLAKTSYFTYDIWCESYLKANISLLPKEPLAPSVAFLDGRLVVSSGNVVKFSKVNEPDNFNFTPDNVPTESDAFFRTITDVNEIFWLYKWGDIYKGQGIAIGTPQKIVYFSSVATLFNTSQIGGLDVPCSRIKPIQITVQGNPANLVVLNGRKKISATIFTRDQSQQIPLTDAIDFFETDPIKKIQSIKYGEDQLLFALTDAGKIYGCLTGGDRLAWFRIQLQYPVRDIATSDYNGVKKLFIVSLIGIGSDYDAVGSINFTEGVKQVSAEYYTNLYMPRSYDFSTEIPKITGVLDYKQKKELTEEEKHKIVKPMQASLTFHNMEVINSTVNTLSTNTNREISNVVLNVKDTNLIRVNYKIKFNGREEIKKEAFTLKALDDNFNTNTLRETIKIYKNSMSANSVKLNIETLENSTIPTIIKSISFDTKYAIK